MRIIFHEIEISERATATDLARKISLLDALYLLKDAWREMESVTIRNCWVKGGLVIGPHEMPASWSIRSLPLDIEEFEKWAVCEADEGAEEEEPETEEAIAAAVLESLTGDSREPVGSDDDSSQGEEEALPDVKEMRKAVVIRRKGLLGRGFEDISMLKKIEDVVESTIEKNLNQSTIDRFFETVP